ncbi:MAG: phosphoribosylanthranilate isomerase [Burkholderiales bacterium]
MSRRVRVKVCGLTRVEDVFAAAQAGADAVGMVFYPPSPRFVGIAQARRLREAVPPFVSTVALFVNASAHDVLRVLDAVRPDVLQFHGEETPEFCRSFGVPYIKACRVRPGVDLLEYLRAFPDAAGWMADAYVDAYGGTGTTFDWSLVPAGLDRPLILSGGLTKDNVAEAIGRVRPWAVDVSSGVEITKGVKDAARISAFISEVQHADV